MSGACHGGVPVDGPARDYINASREQAGLGPVSFDPMLDTAAEAHAAYLARHRVNSHYQSSGRKGFTGRGPGDRVLAAGYPNRSVIEVVSPYASGSEAASVRRSLDDLFAGPYHRLLLLDWTRDELGAACRDQRQMAYVYLLGSRNIVRENPAQPAVVVWPPDDAEEVPPVFFAEEPDPLPDHRFSGYPVSVSFNPAHFRKPPDQVTLRLVEVETGRILPIIVQREKDNDPHGLLTDHQFVLFPRDRLGWGQDYRVELRYHADGWRRHEWSFRTRELDAPMHVITQARQTVRPEPGKPFLIYVPPEKAPDRSDATRTGPAMSYRMTKRKSLRLDADFVDPNVLRVTADGGGDGEIRFRGKRVRIAL